MDHINTFISLVSMDTTELLLLRPLLRNRTEVRNKLQHLTNVQSKDDNAAVQRK